MFTMNPKRRRTLRRAVRVECEVVRARDRRLVGSRTLDLSIDGMLVPTDERVLTGEELLVSFRAPSSVRWLFCEATVARVVHGRRMEDFARCLGIVFEDLDLWSQLVLRDHLRGLPPPLPQRPLRAVLGAA